MDFNNFLQDCFVESRQLKDGLISNLTQLAFLHYLAKLETRKLHLFTGMLCVALLTNNDTFSLQIKFGVFFVMSHNVDHARLGLIPQTEPVGITAGLDSRINGT